MNKIIIKNIKVVGDIEIGDVIIGCAGEILTISSNISTINFINFDSKYLFLLFKNGIITKFSQFAPFNIKTDEGVLENVWIRSFDSICSNGYYILENVDIEFENNKIGEK